MKAYAYSAALYCAHCGEGIRRDLTAAGKAPANPDDESSYDSDAFPKGPYGDGGGEADSPQHCDACGVFLENPLTPDGDAYVRERVEPYRPDGDTSWQEAAEAAERADKPALAEWMRFYLAWGA